MRLTINQFKECLMCPSAHLSTMADAHVVCDKKNIPTPIIWRTTNFAEAEIRKDGKRYILGMPLSEEGHLVCLRKVTLMKRYNSPCVPFSDVLIDEMSFKDRTGKVCKCDLLLHQIPEGETLYEFAEFASREKLLEALEFMESEFKRMGIVHNNLTPHNIIIGDNYQMTAIRYHHAEKETPEKDCSGEFASIREWIKTSIDLEDEHSGVVHHIINKELSASLFSGYKHVGNPFEELVCVANEQGYLYVNYENKVVIEGCFKWAGDFHEGRAEVETETGMGLIDKEGNYIIAPKYDIVDYSVECGLSRVRKDNEWALFNYMGVQILPFEDRYIDDDDLELLSI